jgi:2-polyprenyl-3-methyl-5-hydroxy-6-metoxy-1,4-benzoquinol methylase
VASVSSRPSRALRRLVLAIVGLASMGCASAPATDSTKTLSAQHGPVSVRPGVNDRYMKEGAGARFTEIFEDERREVVEERDAIVAALGLEPGQRVIDVGAGTGLFMGPLSLGVGDTGRVSAVDITPEFLTILREESRGFSNVVVVPGTATDLTLEPDSHDVAVLIDVYHHVEYPELFLASLMRTLRPGGELVVVDFRRIEGVTSKPMLSHVRAGQEVVRSEFEAAGFEFLESRDWMRENYFLRFRRPESS